jgi:beta-galactosidase
VAYWHWHSIHNSIETYWKGLLSHDFLPNPVYDEAKTIGQDFERLSEHLIDLRKRNDIAVMVSNESLTALEWFKLPGGKTYNDVVRWMYDELYKLNASCDFIPAAYENLHNYRMIVVPALYAVSDETLKKLNEYVRRGGHVVYSFKCGFANEQVQVRVSQQPGIIQEACGISYSMFAEPSNVRLSGDSFDPTEESSGVHTWMELITPTTAKVLAYYDHPYWSRYAAVTCNRYGEGTATYIGCMTSGSALSKVLKQVLKEAGLRGADQELQIRH